jgi:murein peptide amidase A
MKRGSQSLVRLLCLLITFCSLSAFADSDAGVEKLMGDLKKLVRNRGYQWDLSVFTPAGLKVHGQSVDNRPLVYFTCGNQDSGNNSLILSSVHGDEVNPLFFGFRLVEWLKARPELCEKGFVVIAPLVNPDGVFRYSKGTRTNFNKVDLNRNFDTPDWGPLALKLWKEKFKERRYYPGDTPASEPETLFQKWLIDEFKPVKILSIHAPLNILDYDGPSHNKDIDAFSRAYIESCESLKSSVQKATPALKLYAYGVFPGSLGNYAGKQRGIPTFTVELPTTESSMVGRYFSDLEAGTKLFITQPVVQKQAAK